MSHYRGVPMGVMIAAIAMWLEARAFWYHYKITFLKKIKKGAALQKVYALLEEKTIGSNILIHTSISLAQTIYTRWLLLFLLSHCFLNLFIIFSIKSKLFVLNI